jgi:hypothetical protein
MLILTNFLRDVAIGRQILQKFGGGSKRLTDQITRFGVGLWVSLSLSLDIWSDEHYFAGIIKNDLNLRRAVRRRKKRSRMLFLSAVSDKFSGKVGEISV